MSRRKKSQAVFWRRWRSLALLAGFAVAGGALEARLIYLQLVDREFLAAQGDDRHIRTVQISAHRGPIVDRNGEPLAVSTPVDTIWANPNDLMPAIERVGELAEIIGVEEDWLVRRVTSNLDREFVYLRRHLRPDDAASALQLGLPGVGTLREYRRYYPSGEVSGHLLGFTNIDDQGQEGLELAYDYWLGGETGHKRVVQDRLGRIIEDVELLAPARAGRTLTTSLDLRVQYLAYRELKRAVAESGALSGSVVILDVETGEVLAMVNQPSFNPNDRSQLDVARYRNRAVTDIFEPGSSFKPFVVAAALETGRYEPTSTIDTSPGYLRVSGRIITQDYNDLGEIDLATILARSSNVGVGKLALDLEQRELWGVLSSFGIGSLTESGFPGESAGVLNDPEYWRPVGQATLAYGYGLSVTALQLAHAYTVIAADGIQRPISLVTVDEPPPGRRVVSATTARAVKGMLETVVSERGTGFRAAVQNYRVAGKTGTAWKSAVGGYSKDRYLAVFAGLAPVTAPKIVAVVIVDEPRGEDYYGGEVAAPVFSRIVGGTLRLLAVPPDALSAPVSTVVARAERARDEVAQAGGTP
ncbi:MAG: penicillin-binding protein 2 [Gammaproteobacteria bacterium]|nr:penicillin-binding protein 2 [Gammaproteobacteria bacterium]